MFNFRRNKQNHHFYIPPTRDLMKQPGVPYVSNKCIAVYSPVLDGVMVTTGDFSDLSREEVDLIVMRKHSEILALSL